MLNVIDINQRMRECPCPEESDDHVVVTYENTVKCWDGKTRKRQMRFTKGYFRRLVYAYGSVEKAKNYLDINLANDGRPRTQEEIQGAKNMIEKLRKLRS